MIGADFDKIRFEWFGFHLQEPMAFVTDTIISILCLYFVFRLSKLQETDHPFYTYWKYFFILFGIGSIGGALGHLLFQYWGVFGKFPSWFLGIVAVYSLEQGMIALHPDQRRFSILKTLSQLKMVAVFAAVTLVCLYGPIHEKPSLGFLPIAINTIIGVLLAAGFLGFAYVKKLSPIYKYFIWGVLVMLPSAFIFLLKINLHQWFDKNDFSHVLLAIGITYFYLGVKAVKKAELV